LTCIMHIDYYMAFFISYPLSALGHDTSQRANEVSGCLVRNGCKWT
jgi:hypothetical protein